MFLYNSLLIIKYVFFLVWVLKKGFLIVKVVRFDVYRVVNYFLRMVLIGRICLCLRFLGYIVDEGKVVVYLKLIKNLCIMEFRILFNILVILLL